jgi:hypothetical protein
MNDITSQQTLQGKAFLIQTTHGHLSLRDEQRSPKLQDIPTTTHNPSIAMLELQSSRREDHIGVYIDGLPGNLLAKAGTTVGELI